MLSDLVLFREYLPVALSWMSSDFGIEIYLVSNHWTDLEPFAYYGCQRSKFSVLNGHQLHVRKSLFATSNVVHLPMSELMVLQWSRC